MAKGDSPAENRRTGWVGIVSVVAFLPTWVLFVRADSQFLFTVGYHVGVIIPCLSIAWHVWRYRPEHPVFWLGISAYYAATIPTTTLWLVELWRTGQVDMLGSPPVRVASVVLSSVAAVTAMISLLVVRRRSVATWATADALVIGLAAACTLLVTNVLPLHAVLGWSTGFWTAGVVVSIRFVVLIAVTVTLLYSEQIRSVPLGVVLGAFLVWAVAEPVWVAGGPTLSPTGAMVLRALMVSCGYAALIVAIHPAMRDVAMPSVSVRPTWTIGRTIALAAGLVAPLVAVRYRPPTTDGHLVVVLVAFGILLVAVVIRMRVSVLAAHHLLSRVERQADHDELTGLPNRRRCTAPVWTNSSSRHGPARPTASWSRIWTSTTCGR